MSHLNGQLARDLNRYLGRQHQLFARRYSMEQVLDEDAELERLVYILTNPQKANLVDAIEQWPGLSSAPFLFEGKSQRFVRFDRTSWHQHHRPRNIAPFLHTVELKHRVLPHLQDMPEQDRRSLLQRLVREQEAKLREGRRSEGQRPLSKDKLEEVASTDRPRNRKRSPEPLCHTTRPELARAFLKSWRNYNFQYRQSAKRYRNGEVGVLFPLGARAPSRLPRACHPTEDGSGLVYLLRRHIAVLALAA
jgi:hypothetical protein